MVTLSYTLWSYDVWGNEEDGFEVNDRSCQTRNFQVEVGDEGVSDNAIIGALVANGYLSRNVRVDVEGDDLRLEVSKASNGYPLYGLELNQD